MKNCTVIGISDSHNQWFPPEILAVISRGKVFSGGKRHYEIMSPLLPEGAQWIDITVPLANVFAQYESHDDIVIFASGDPLFYGFANTIQRECPATEMKVYACFNSIQMLAHRLNMPYHDLHVVSLTGRPWGRFDEALINGEQLIGVLTDKVHTPHAIAQRMREYGYVNYMMYVGMSMGNEEQERIVSMDLSGNIDELRSITAINCIILKRTYTRNRIFGIPESEFHLLNGRAKMITKMPVRLVSLSYMDLYQKRSLWDVGFCTGSISIEAKLQFPHLDVTSFEIREEGRELMEKNSRKFGAVGITSVIGDFLETDISSYPMPDAVFIGGHGGRLREMIAKLYSVLMPGGCIVFNSVSEESMALFLKGIEDVGMKEVARTRLAVDEHNAINIIKAIK